MFRLMRGAAGAAVLSVVVTGAALVPAAVASAGTNLLPNGSFDGGSTAGWRPVKAALSLVSPGFGGSADAVKVTLSGTSTWYNMHAYPKPVTNLAQGTQLQGSGEVLGVAGRSLCLKVQEYTPGGSLVQTAKQCVSASGSWQPIGPANLTIKTTGDAAGFTIAQAGAKAGDSFQADSLTLTGSSSSPPPPSSSTLAALWHMNEPAGATTMADSSGNGNNGTLAGGVKTGVAGFKGKAYSFSGKSYVDVPNAPSLIPGPANVDISFWLKTTHLPSSGDYDLVRMGVYPGQEYKVELLTTSKIECTFHGSAGSNTAIGGWHVANGKWHHIECIKTATQIQLKIGGRLVKTTTATIGSVSPISDVTLGAHPGSDWYQGLLDEVSVTFS